MWKALEKAASAFEVYEREHPVKRLAIKLVLIVLHLLISPPVLWLFFSWWAGDVLIDTLGMPERFATATAFVLGVFCLVAPLAVISVA